VVSNDGADARDAQPPDAPGSAPAGPPDSDTLDVVLEDLDPEQLASGICPYCRSEFTEGPPIAICRACHTPHHRDCWHENGGCTTYGCRGAPRPEDVRARRAEADEPAVEVPVSLLPHHVPTVSERVAWAVVLANWAIALSALGGLGVLIRNGTPLLGLCVLGIVLADRALCSVKSHDGGVNEVSSRAAWAIALGLLLILTGIGRWLTMGDGVVGQPGH
jgi:hypothetical protein